MEYTPSMLVTLRSVPPEERSLAVGLSTIILRLIGTIPGPIIMGAIFDSVCLYWEETCGE